MEFKQVIVVRKDLAMGTGKLAAQVAHAAVMGVENAKVHNPSWFNSWLKFGQAKVVVQVESLQGLIEIREAAEDLDLSVVEVQDSGLTQIPSGTITCVAIGPGPTNKIDKITGRLKLL